MKQFTLFFSLISLLFLSGVCEAQEETQVDNPVKQGRIIIDVDFALEFGTFDSSNAFFDGDISTDRNEFETDIDFGYSVIDNLVLGLGIVVDNVNNEASIPGAADGSFGSSTAESTSNGISLLATGKYFFLQDRIRPFLGAGAGIVSSKTESISGGSTSESKGSGFAYNIKAGCAFFINDHIGFEVLYKYNGHNLDIDNTITPGNISYDTEDSASNSAILMGVIVAF